MRGNRFVDITGQRFGRLTVESVAGHAGKAITWNCRCDCGISCIVPGVRLRKGYTKSCGCFRREIKSLQFRRQTGEMNPNWKGGRHISSGGYVLIWCFNEQRYVGEHVLVMRKILGRMLFSDETVHHKNGVRHDNRPENLELMVSNHPSGQRIEDIRAWAKEILRRYPD